MFADKGTAGGRHASLPLTKRPAYHRWRWLTPPGDGSRRTAHSLLQPDATWLMGPALKIDEETGRDSSVTQQYLIGELSVRLEQLQSTTTPSAAREVTRLRYQVEAGPPAGLTWAASRALALADGLCWESLSRGDTAAFARQAAVSAELRHFGVCARLLPDRY